MRRLTRAERVRNMTSKHDGFYGYEKWGDVANSHQKSVVVCPVHGEFETTYARHYTKGSGCYHCGLQKLSENMAERNKDPEFQRRRGEAVRTIRSRAEGYARHYLESEGFTEPEDFETEKYIPNSNRRFDFWLPYYNLIIELHGEQHYEGWSGDPNKLREKQMNDRIKKEWAEKRGHNLLVIPYWDFDHIPVILAEALGL